MCVCVEAVKGSGAWEEVKGSSCHADRGKRPYDFHLVNVRVSVGVVQYVNAVLFGG